MAQGHTITDLLNEWHSGNNDALNVLMTRVEERLRAIARYKLRIEYSSPFQTTELIHESVVSLLEKGGLPIHNRQHFYGLMSTIMTRILIDCGRRRHALKHGGKVEYQEEGDFPDETGLTDEQFALHQAIVKLSEVSQEAEVIIRLKYFWGLTSEEIQSLLGLSLPTVTRRLSFAKSWLAAYLRS